MSMKRLREGGAKILFLAAALISVVAVGLICAFLLGSGVPAIAEIGFMDFILGTEWRPANDVYGIFPMILGSIYVTGGAILFGMPIGILTAAYLSRFASGAVKRIFKPAVDLLAGIPSVVYGFFGLMVLAPLVRSLLGGNGHSILTASLLLGIMILPTIVSVAKASIDAVPKSYYEGALALGATHEESVFKVLLPAAKPGVLAGVILGVGRAVGETMAVIMVAGNQARIPVDILKGVRTMTANIALEMGYAADLHRGALVGTAVVLFAFILIINLCFSVLKRKKI